MTDKELQKLGRRELLQLLLEQAKETERLGRVLAETEGQLHELEETYERLRGRLDHKDVQMHELKEAMEAQMNELEETNVRLRGRLDYKDAQIAELRAEREKLNVELSEAGSIAEAALKLNGVFEAAQKAADQYLKSIQTLYPIPEGMEPSHIWEEAEVEILPPENVEVPETGSMCKAPEQPKAVEVEHVEVPEPPKEAVDAEKPDRQTEKGLLQRKGKGELQPRKPQKPKKVEKGKWTLFFGVEKV